MMVETAVVVRLTRLSAELAADRAALDARATELGDLVSRWDRDGSLPRADLVLAAVNLHGWYTGLEAALERVARLLDQTVPTGASWHTDLLAQMQLEVPGVRPAIVPVASLRKLHELRRFRHFFRNAYVLNLDPLRVRERAKELLQVHPSLASSFHRLEDHLQAVLRELVERK